MNPTRNSSGKREKSIADVALSMERTPSRCSNVCGLCATEGLSQEICTSGEIAVMTFGFAWLNRSVPGLTRETVR